MTTGKHPVKHSMLDRFAIDDGRHLPKIVIDEDASTAADTARYRAACSCGRMPQQPAGTRAQALAAHLAHVNTKIGPPKGPQWLPVGARIVILLVAMLAIWGACYATGQIITHDQALTGAAAKGVVGGSQLMGLVLALGLMVGVRRYIAPTRI
ncbi:hypothetical protein [Streptomyces justiciae]|uniref:hypothetical protein n=1 Tax=Streptomyces justiciae TaxID=2780140 RepID=UPI00211832BC|nr:hypothetical protein [Streptomyces justiciae]MCW8383924.1 hypothetical protein [Streptomyces justiciae]